MSTDKDERLPVKLSLPLVRLCTAVCGHSLNCRSHTSRTFSMNFVQRMSLSFLPGD
jgi:hypothetical protein